MVRMVLRMYKISRVIALLEVMKKIEENNYEDANRMMAIVTKSIKNDKKHNQYSSYISLNKKEAKLFDHYIECKEQD